MEAARVNYALIRDEESEGDEKESPTPEPVTIWHYGSLPRWVIWVAVVDLSLLLLAMTGFGFSAWLAAKPLSDHELIIKTNAWSPLLERTAPRFQMETLKTALINRHNTGGPSIYRQKPSPEVDEAWRKLHKGERLFLISEAEVRRMGKDPKYVIEAPESWGHGPGWYLAMNQGQHDLHCLNYLRMFAYSDYYYGNRTDRVQIHALHCLHTLLQTLQCKYSTDVYTGMWVVGYDPPAVDFNVTRKCMTYESILSWSPERPYSEEQFAALRPPPGVKRIPNHVY